MQKSPEVNYFQLTRGPCMTSPQQDSLLPAVRQGDADHETAT
ncbi:DUF5431 family protein [Erwinia sp. E602]